MYLTYRVGKVRREVSTRDPEVARRHVGRRPRRRLSVSGMLLSQDVRPAGSRRSTASAASTASSRALQIRQAMVGRWFFMIIGTIFSITPAFVYWLAGTLAVNGDPTRADGRRRSSPSRRSRAGSSSRSASCSTSRSRSRARSPCSTGSSSTSSSIPRSSTRPTPWRSTRRRSRGRVRFRDVSFRYPAERRCAVDGGDAADGGRRRGATPARDEAVAEPRERRRSRPLAAPSAAAPSRRAPFALEDIDFEVEPGRARRARRPVGLRQDHDDLPDPAALRRRRRARSRSTAATSASSRSPRSASRSAS